MSHARPVLSGLFLAIAVILGAGVLAAVTASPGWAHNTVVSTVPAQKALVAASPPAVEVRFDQPVGKRFHEVAVTGPDGKRWEDGDSTVAGAVLRQRLLPLGPAGTYRVSWRAVSADGHTTSQSFSFTLTRAGDGTPRARAGGDETRQPDAGEDGADREESKRADDGDPGWPALTVGLVVGVLAVVGGALLLLARITGRGRAARNDQDETEADEDDDGQDTERR